MNRTLARWLALCACATVLSVAGPLRAQMVGASVQPQILKDVGVDQKLDAQIPLDLAFRDEHSQPVQLRQFFGSKPILLTLVYYQCPMLCTQVLNSTLGTLKQLPIEIGKDFDVLTVSIDPTDKPNMADARQTMYAGLYGRPGAVRGWHFLTGADPQIKALASAVGFRYAYDASTQQYAHPAVIMILTPEGRMSRYFYGIQYPARDVRLGLVEASEGRIGSPVDAVLLYCFHYDPNTGKYGLVIMNIVQASGILTVLALAILMFVLFRREKYSLPERRASSGAQTEIRP
ncbi:MAG: SCO family protein [Candidatus Acidiferrales bacterium]